MIVPYNKLFETETDRPWVEGILFCILRYFQRNEISHGFERTLDTL